jgi:outer membrane protein assembly factor BamB
MPDEFTWRSSISRRRTFDPVRVKRSHIAFPAALLLTGAIAHAADWPQFRGPDRDGVWSEAGIPETFPIGGLKVRWRAPVGFGHASPVVAGGRVFLIGSEEDKPKARERVQCFDEQTGQRLWTYAYEAPYPDWAFDLSIMGGNRHGPNPTPVAEAGKLYTLGAAGQMLCLDAVRGTVIWERDLAQDHDLNLEEFPNMTPSPLIEGGLLIVVIRARASTSVAAFDKASGRPVWEALSEPFTYSSPIVIGAGGKRQLIVWTPKAVTSLDPATGRTWWREELATSEGTATPVWQGDRLLVSGLMFRLEPDPPAASLLWPGRNARSRYLLSSTSMPLILGDHVYSGDKSGRLVCLDARTGEQVWRTDTLTTPGGGATLHLTPNGGSVLVFTDEGNLIRARLTPEGCEELGRVRLIEPTHFYNGRKLVWSPPAYANGCVFARNDHELLCASLTE